MAKVQLAASSSSTAKAGLMLRQSNEASSPFVFVYVQNSKVMVEYRDAATNQVVTLEGGVLSALTEARFLKIERLALSGAEGKEGSVYVYESGDGVNWRQITVLALALTGSVNVGLNASVTNGFVHAQEDEIQVQQSQSGEQPIESGKAIVDGINPLGVILPSGAATGVSSGSVKSPTEISLNVYANRPDSRDARFTPVGPRAVAEIPMSALDFSNPSTTLIAIWMPANPELKKNAYRVLQEVSVTLGDGTEYVFLDNYGDQLAVQITPAILDPIFEKFSKPDILKVSVQPVDAKSWYEDLAPGITKNKKSDSGTFKSQSVLTTTAEQTQ